MTRFVHFGAVVACCLALVASSGRVSSLSGFESDGFRGGRGSGSLLEGHSGLLGFRSGPYFPKYGPRVALGRWRYSSLGGVAEDIRFYRFCVGRVT